MELLNVYNEQKELTNLRKKIIDFNDNEYSMSTLIWIVNRKNEMLVQLRSYTDDKKPGTWDITGGAVEKDETSLSAAIRELKEELGLNINKEQLIFIASERRKKRFLEYYLLLIDIDINNLVLQKDEVEEVKWITLDEYENDISNSLNFQIFKNFYNNIYLNKEK